jgi:hypothetical protein
MFESPTMDHDYFMRLADTFRSPHLWLRDEAAAAAGGLPWKLRSAAWHGA